MIISPLRLSCCKPTMRLTLQDLLLNMRLGPGIYLFTVTVDGQLHCVVISKSKILHLSASCQLEARKF